MRLQHAALRGQRIALVVGGLINVAGVLVTVCAKERRRNNLPTCPFSREPLASASAARACQRLAAKRAKEIRERSQAAIQVTARGLTAGHATTSCRVHCLARVCRLLSVSFVE